MDKKVKQAIENLAKNIQERNAGTEDDPKADLDDIITNLTTEFEEIKAKIVEGGFEGDVDFMARSTLMSNHRRIKILKRRKSKRKYELGNLVGFMIGDLGMVDDAARMREWAKYCVDNRGLEYAKDHQLVVEMAGEIRVLDTRKKIFGRPNKGFNQPLKPTLKLRRRNIVMLAKQADEENFVYTRLQTNSNKLAIAWSQLPMHVPVAFPASIQTHDASGYMLSSSSAKDSMTIFRQLKEDWDIYKEFEKALKPDLTPIKNVEKYHEATKDAWDRWVVVRGVVASMAFENQTYRGIPCTLVDAEAGYDADESVTFYIPEHLKITFGVYSEIYLIGKTRAIKDTIEDTDSGKPKKITIAVVIDAWGFMPVPGRTTQPKSSLLEVEEDEEVIEGFIKI